MHENPALRAVKGKEQCGQCDCKYSIANAEIIASCTNEVGNSRRIQKAQPIVEILTVMVKMKATLTPDGG